MSYSEMDKWVMSFFVSKSMSKYWKKKSNTWEFQCVNDPCYFLCWWGVQHDYLFYLKGLIV